MNKKSFQIVALILIFFSCNKKDNLLVNVKKGNIIFDNEGNLYTTVVIGSQEWVVQNLKTTHYNNGDRIQEVSDNSWRDARGGCFCYQGNDKINSNVHGILYNWYTVADSRGICPKGFKIPTNNDWKILSDYLKNDAGSVKAMIGWNNVKSKTTNATGLTIYPSGNRSWSGTFYDIGTVAQFWCKNSDQTIIVANGHSVGFNEGSAFIFDGSRAETGLSIRCLRE
jgi:uncharacterized protein (TIGR02145 family)